LLALSMIPKPRSVHAMRQADAQGPVRLAEVGSRYPVGGDLLRALRLRKGWSRSEAGLAVGASAGAVSQWEQGHRRPSGDVLAGLAQALGADDDETSALLADGPTRRPIFTVDEALRAMESAASEVWLGHGRGADLKLALIEADVWRLAQTDPLGAALLGQTKSARAMAAIFFDNVSEARRLARSARDLPYELGPSHIPPCPGPILCIGRTFSLNRAKLVEQDLHRNPTGKRRMFALANAASAHAASGNTALAEARWSELEKLKAEQDCQDARVMDHSFFELCLFLGKVERALAFIEDVPNETWVHRQYGGPILGMACVLGGDPEKAWKYLVPAFGNQNSQTMRGEVLSIVRRLVEVHPDKKATRLLNAMINDGLHSRPTVD
jgi:transcriptional regulator with XRE-family HTH domain